MRRHDCACYAIGDMASGLVELAESAFEQYMLSVDPPGQPGEYTLQHVMQYPLKDMFHLCEQINERHPEYYDDMVEVSAAIDKIGRYVEWVMAPEGSRADEPEIEEMYNDEGLGPLLDELMWVCSRVAKKILRNCVQDEGE